MLERQLIRLQVGAAGTAWQHAGCRSINSRAARRVLSVCLRFLCFHDTSVVLGRILPSLCALFLCIG